MNKSQTEKELQDAEDALLCSKALTKSSINTILKYKKQTEKLLDALIETTKAICNLMDKHSCGDLERYLMPIFFDNKEIIEKYKDKTWEEINK